ncbi:MAG TPA: site-2 protease family protein [Verrucomicrobiae bacterium]|nr:site-2 protease family protein [Verrucomicrobiae bacterium]
MFGKRIPLFKLFGFQVRIDLSWLIIAVLVTWTLAVGLFPHYFRGQPRETYWIMGSVAALGLFASIVFHEFAHSLVARRFGMQMKGITLFIFGGVAEMSDEPPSPKAEFFMAIAGPLSSVVLALVFFGLGLLGKAASWPVPVYGILGYLAWINGILVAFNLVPAFPLDGGRVARSILWGWKKNLPWATRIVTALGSGFGMLLIALGIFSFLFGDMIGGIWWFLIGMFLRNAAQMSYQQVMMREALQGEPLRHFMNPNPVTVSPTTSVEDFVENYIYRYHHKLFPVVTDGQLLGCVTFNQVKQIPKQEWSRHQVSELTRQCAEDNAIDADTDAVNALARMNQAHVSRMMVVEGQKLVGVVSLKDLLKFLSLKVELEKR